MFEINYTQAESLFGTGYYDYNKQSRLDVAERIEEFVENGGDISSYGHHDYDEEEDYEDDE